MGRRRLFYMEGVEFLVDTGELEIARDAQELMNIRIVSPKTSWIYLRLCSV